MGTSRSLTLQDPVLGGVPRCPVGAVQPASKPRAPAAAVPLLQAHSVGTKNLSVCPSGGAAPRWLPGSLVHGAGVLGGSRGSVNLTLALSAPQLPAPSAGICGVVGAASCRELMSPAQDTIQSPKSATKSQSGDDAFWGKEVSLGTPSTWRSPCAACVWWPVLRRNLQLPMDIDGAEALRQAPPAPRAPRKAFP